MADTETTTFKRKKKCTISFSNVPQKQAERILGFKFVPFYYQQKPLDQFITEKAPDSLKKKIFNRLVDCIRSEGYPEASLSPLNEAVVTDFVGNILQPMVAHFYCSRTRKDIELTRETQIISRDEEVGGNMEFVVMHSIDDDNDRYVIVIEAKRGALGKGLTQLLLALKSAFGINNDQKKVYGFLTTAIQWQLITYDGQTWKLSRPSPLLCGDMDKEEDQWLKDNTQVLDMIYSILSSL